MELQREDMQKWIAGDWSGLRRHSSGRFSVYYWQSIYHTLKVDYR